MDRRQFISAAIAAGGVSLLPETAQAAELPTLETSSPVMRQYDGQYVTLTWGNWSASGIVRFIEPPEPMPPIYLTKRDPSVWSFSIDLDSP